MSESYGSRIYKQPAGKKSPVLPIALVIAILSGGYFFFKSLRKPVLDAVPTSEDSRGVVETNIPAGEKTSKPRSQTTTDSVPATDGAAETKTPIKNNKDSTSIALNPPGRMPDMSAERKRAEKLFKTAKYKEALEIYLKISREDVTAYSEVGMCYFMLQDYPSARRYLEDALANDRGNFDTLKYMAFTCYRQDKLEESRGLAEEAARVNDKDREINWLLDRLSREITVMEDGYKDVRIPKFKLQFSRADHQDARDLVLDILKKAYREIGQQLNYYPEQDITVILYNDQTFFDVTRSPGWAGGLYDGKIRMPIQNYEGHEDELERVLFHEYTHALVHFLAGKCPLWMNEGLAEYFSVGDEEKIGQILPLQMLENRFPPDHHVVMVAYIESYSVVSDMVDKFGLYRIKELLEAQRELNDIRKAFDKVLYTSYDRFIETWGKD